jgi:hypothetical protein
MWKRFERLHGRVEAAVLGVLAVVIAIAWLMSRLTGS